MKVFSVSNEKYKDIVDRVPVWKENEDPKKYLIGAFKTANRCQSLIPRKVGSNAPFIVSKNIATSLHTLIFDKGETLSSLGIFDLIKKYDKQGFANAMRYAEDFEKSYKYGSKPSEEAIRNLNYLAAQLVWVVY